MAEITRPRTGIFLREVFRILINKPEGMPAKEVLAELPKAIPLTDYESGYYPSALISSVVTGKVDVQG